MGAIAVASKLHLKIARVIRRWPAARWAASTPNPILREALGGWADAGSDIHDHLGTILYEAAAVRPRLIVELGTRGGISTRALLAAAEIADAHVLSIDIVDCSQLELPDRFRGRWTFAQADDVAFAGQPFADFCDRRGLPRYADFVLVDTSHVYDHTRREIACWSARLSPRGVMLFHDTNMGGGWFRRLDGKAEPGWDNSRGVIRAIEQLVGRSYDETTYFTDVAGGYAIDHVPWSNGLTVLRKLEWTGAGATHPGSPRHP